MKVTLHLEKSVTENANIYFDKAKKAKKKLKSLRVHKEQFVVKPKVEVQQQEKTVEKKEWFHQFRWCLLSNGMLAVAGRDAQTNENLIKKHTEPHDKVLHTDMAGSPFVVIKSNGKDIPESIEEEAAVITASFSKAWQKGYTSMEVFSANPDQISKHAQTKEHLSKGAFVIRGKLTYYNPELLLACGYTESGFMVGPIQAIQQHAPKGMIIRQGTKKPTDAARQIAKYFSTTDVDRVAKSLPTGGVSVEPMPRYRK